MVSTTSTAYETHATPDGIMLIRNTSARDEQGNLLCLESTKLGVYPSMDDAAQALLGETDRGERHV